MKLLIQLHHFFFLVLIMTTRTVKSLSASIAMNKPVGNGVVIHWFRLGDMRLHDNPALDRSIKTASETKSNLAPVFCFDPRTFGDEARSELGYLKCGPRRAKFILESVSDLRQSLENKGCNLLVVRSKPEDFFASLLKETNLRSSKIVYQAEVCSEERDVELKVRKLFSSAEAVWGSTLFNLEDLPYSDISELPDTFTPFRNMVEKKCTIRDPLQFPKKIPTLPVGDSPSLKEHISYMPDLKDLGYTEEQIKSVEIFDSRGVMDFKGGETAALARVKDYIWDKDLLRKYFDTRNGMLGSDYSTKFAPWLAHGNLSPRYVASECRKYEKERIENKSTYWVVFELLWRDYFKFFAHKHGKSMFNVGGTIESTKKWHTYEKSLNAWLDGHTGYPLVDANMRELKASGFMSNRGRQNVCSFLALEIKHDWRHGAAYFEETLLDYDVHSNWGNWCSGAGMTGGRVNRFNIVKQSKDYDQHGDYVRHWLPELKNVPTLYVHEPWKMNQSQQKEFACRLGVDYPNPIVKPFENSRGGGDRGKGGRSGRGNNRPNPNRSRGQRNEMKSLRKGSIRMD